jgi:hypothetical protein
MLPIKARNMPGSESAARLGNKLIFKDILRRAANLLGKKSGAVDTFMSQINQGKDNFVGAKRLRAHRLKIPSRGCFKVFGP